MKILHIVHNYPYFAAGGAETYAMKLHRYLVEATDHESYVLAVTPFPNSFRAHDTTVFYTTPDSMHESFLKSEVLDFDHFMVNSRNIPRDIQLFLEFYNPDVIHLQHYLYFGVNFITMVRSILPQSRIILTLHEYGAICNNHGQMVTTQGVLCLQESADACNKCYPMYSSEIFKSRKEQILGHFANIDMFISPSTFLASRYVSWGINPNKIVVEKNGFTFSEIPTHTDRPINKNTVAFGYLGQLNAFKGIDVLLRATQLLVANHNLGDDFTVHIYGANLEIQPKTFQDNIKILLRKCTKNVYVHQPYKPNEITKILANIDVVVVPSLWWENSPLVIQEAHHHGVPVICSDIGGMPELVRHEFDGWHFRVGDHHDLADVMRRLIRDQESIRKCAANAPQAHSMLDHVRRLVEVYTNPQ